jgi:hypothetical protein
LKLESHLLYQYYYSWIFNLPDNFPPCMNYPQKPVYSARVFTFNCHAVEILWYSKCCTYNIQIETEYSNPANFLSSFFCGAHIRKNTKNFSRKRKKSLFVCGCWLFQLFLTCLFLDPTSLSHITRYKFSTCMRGNLDLKVSRVYKSVLGCTASDHIYPDP